MQIGILLALGPELLILPLGNLGHDKA